MKDESHLIVEITRIKNLIKEVLPHEKFCQTIKKIINKTEIEF